MAVKDLSSFKKFKIFLEAAAGPDLTAEVSRPNSSSAFCLSLPAGSLLPSGRFSRMARTKILNTWDAENTEITIPAYQRTLP